MAALSDYDSSAIDWVRLRQYAKKVAKCTKVQPEPQLTYITTNFEKVKLQKTEPRFLWFKPRIEEVEEWRDVKKVVTVLGPHWVLEKRRWTREERTKVHSTAVEETDDDELLVILTATGELKHVRLHHNLVTNRDTNGFRVVVNDRDHEVRDLDSEDVIKMDYTLSPRSSEHGNVSVTSSRERGSRLIRHAKGVGINLALKKLLDG